jgi:uncharacterized protein YgiM (DUF1202 family)
MVKPVFPETVAEQANIESKETSATETTATITKTVKPVKTPQNVASSSANTGKLPTTVPLSTIPPTTTTTFLLPPTVVNGAQVENPIALGNAKYVKILVNGLNVRANPSSGGAVVGAIRKNETVMVLGYKEQWLYIRTGKNVSGFIKADTKFEKPVN